MEKNNLNREYNYDGNFQQEFLDGNILPLDNCIRKRFYLENCELFFKECSEYNLYYELIGSKIATYIGIRHVDYDMATVKFNDIFLQGVVSNNFHKDGSRIFNFASLFDDYSFQTNDNIDEIMNIEFIWKVFSFRYKDYDNKVLLKLMEELITYFLFDILIGNRDNGKYNYEVIESENDVLLCPYYDFGEIFNFKNTRFVVSNNDDNGIYAVLEKFLSLSNFFDFDKFYKMYEILTPLKLEEILVEVENEKGIVLPNNFKNMLFLIYNRHYLKLTEIIDKCRHNVIVKK